MSEISTRIPLLPLHHLAGIALQQTGFTDTIVWTPWEDMPDCYESFCCVENAKAVKPVTLDPNDTWNATTRFAVYTA